MPATVAQAFEKRQVAREDGVNVLPRRLIAVAAMEAGYHLTSPVIEEAARGAKYPGQMTEEEFIAFCESHQSALVTPEEMAKAVVVIAPGGIITRGSLEKIVNKTSNKENALTDEETDALFDALDTENKSAITAEDLMRALYGEEGALCLAERRKMELEEAPARIQKHEEEEAAAAAAQEAEEEKRRQEEEEAARKAEEEKKKEEEAAAKAEEAKKAEEGKKAAEKAAPPPKKEKTKACC